MSEKPPHVCKPMKPTCCCYMLADEPSWNCPIHSGALNNRCECGRYVHISFYDAASEPPATAEREK